jgi:hypothetical protein
MQGNLGQPELLGRQDPRVARNLAAQIADCAKARNASIYDRCKVHWAAWQ